MRVLVADDQAEVRSALRLLLEQEPWLRVVGEATEADGLLGQVHSMRPDVVLLDWELPGLQASDLLPVLRSLCPRAQVVALSGRPEARWAALASGASFFVSKCDPPERLLTTLRAIGSGGIA